MARIFRNQRDALRLAKASNNFVEMMYGDPNNPRVVYPPEKPKRASPVRDPRRVSEADVNKDIRHYAGARPDLVLWRNNRGHVDLPGGGRIMYGVGPNGAGDWIGYKRLTIMPDMVGKTFALFVSVEAKAPDGAVQKNQQDFLDKVQTDGGKAIIARSGTDLDKI